MAKTLVGSFDTFEHASRVVDALERTGVPHGDLNLVANDAAGRLAAGRGGAGGSAAMSRTRTSGDATSEGAAGDETVASGAGKGAVAGGLIGGLRQLGVSDTDAQYHAEAVRRGGALVIVRADDARAQAVADAMRSHGAIDIEQRVASWRESGWTGFDDRAQPYTAEQIERERVVASGTSYGGGREVEGADLRGGRTAGTTATAGPLGGTTVGTGTTAGTPRTADHPNLGTGPDRPGVDTRHGEHARTGRAGMAGGDDASPGGSRSMSERASDAIERRIPGDSDGDGR